MRIELFSLDMFQTLADILSLKYVIWKQILGDQFHRGLADEYWPRSSELIFDQICQLDVNQFEPIHEVFAKGYTRILTEIPQRFDPEFAAAVMCDHHPLCQIFPDTPDFLDWASRQATVCLSSDTDDVMLGTLADQFKFDHIFTSEDIGAYKIQKNQTFFTTVLDFYKISPQTVLHIGDSPADVIGANQAGIRTCWINRNDRTWNWETRPDIIVHSLDEIPEILD